MILALLLLIALGRAAGAPDPEFSALRQLQLQGAAVTALVVDLDTGNRLAALEPERRLVPASLTKLFTAVAALEAWGPYGTFTTRLLSDAALVDGTLEGDLILLGGGDPALTTRGLWALVGTLRSAGLERVAGRLMINESRFGSVACVTLDRCAARRSSRNAYDAPLSSAGVNYGAWCVAITPGPRPGSPARAVTCPFDFPEVAVHGRVRTVPAGHRGRLNVSRTTDDADDALWVSGTIAANAGTRRFYRAASSPARQTGVILHRLLTLSGVRVDRGTAVTSAPPPGGAREIASVTSIPLSELLARMLTYSNNYMADVLALDLVAGDPTVSRPLTLPRAGARVLEISGPATPADIAGVSAVLLSGSGLTVDNALSATDIVSLLKGVYRRSDLFPSFVGALTVPRFSPLGIFRGQNPDWMTRIAAKTGSMNEPVPVYGIAGYFRKHNGGWGAFALLINGTGKHPGIPFATAMGAIRHDVSRLLERY